jgi:hypothetical protein
MSPYESALLDALRVVLPALVRLGADQEELRRELREQAEQAQEWGSEDRAETLRYIARFSIPERALGADTTGEQPRD